MTLATPAGENTSLHFVCCTIVLRGINKLKLELILLSHASRLCVSNFTKSDFFALYSLVIVQHNRKTFTFFFGGGGSGGLGVVGERQLRLSLYTQGGSFVFGSYILIYILIFCFCLKRYFVFVCPYQHNSNSPPDWAP